jgi:hypothetical protein
VASWTSHSASPIMIEAFPINPVPVRVSRVSRPSEPETNQSPKSCHLLMVWICSWCCARQEGFGTKAAPWDGEIPVTTGVLSSDHSKPQSPEHLDEMPLMITSTCGNHDNSDHTPVEPAAVYPGFKPCADLTVAAVSYLRGSLQRAE